MFRICFVCTGNICRSPMAEVVLRRLLEDAGLDQDVVVDSAGTGDWHIGERADRRTVTALHEAGYDGSAHRARVLEAEWLAHRDLVVALDSGHLRELRSLAARIDGAADVRLLRSFVGGADGIDGTDGEGLDVADPYYGDARDFADVLAQVEQACRGLLEHLVRSGDVPAPRP